MKKQIKVTSLALLLGTSLSIVTPSVMVLSAENEPDSQTTLWDIERETNPGYDETHKGDAIHENEDITIENTEDGLVVTKYEKIIDNNSGRFKRANVSRWGAWEYTNIAISKGVLTGIINTGLSKGVGFVASSIGLPGWAIGNLLTTAGWTNKGNAPGKAVAELWDKNKNGWVAFYYQRGYDAAGKVVATRYKTL